MRHCASKSPPTQAQSSGGGGGSSPRASPLRDGVVPEHADGLAALLGLQQDVLHQDGPLQGAGQCSPLAVHRRAHHWRVNDRPVRQPGVERRGHGKDALRRRSSQSRAPSPGARRADLSRRPGAGAPATVPEKCPAPSRTGRTWGTGHPQAKGGLWK